MTPIIKYELAHIRSNIINIDEDLIDYDSIGDVNDEFYDSNFDKCENQMNKHQNLFRKNI